MRETVNIYISHGVDIWTEEKVKSWHFSKGRVLTLDQSMQGRLEMWDELDIKMWVKDLIAERLERERLESGKPKIYSRNMWASADRGGQSGECSQGVEEWGQEVSTHLCPNLMPLLHHRLWETSRMIRHCFNNMKSVRTTALSLCLCRPWPPCSTVSGVLLMAHRLQLLPGLVSTVFYASQTAFPL